jgi:hypothetical protein
MNVETSVLNNSSSYLGHSSERDYGENYYLQLSTIDGGCCAMNKNHSSDETELYRIRAEVIDLLNAHFFCSPHRANINRVQCHLHPMLKIMWEKAEEWHLLPSDHCDVYGFNIWAPIWLEEKTDMCFGGKSERKIWNLASGSRFADGKSSRSCAADGWICCMAFSEFDYLLFCVDQKSSQYGHVHHVNIHRDEENFCCTVDELFVYLLDFVNEGKALKKSARRDNVPKLNRGLKRIREAVLEAVR